MNDSMLALPWQKPQNRRWLVAGIVMLTLVVMGFYTITNPERLAGSMLLGGQMWLDTLSAIVLPIAHLRLVVASFLSVLAVRVCIWGSC